MRSQLLVLLCFVLAAVAVLGDTSSSALSFDSLSSAGSNAGAHVHGDENATEVVLGPQESKSLRVAVESDAEDSLQEAVPRYANNGGQGRLTVGDRIKMITKNKYNKVKDKVKRGYNYVVHGGWRRQPPSPPRPAYPYPAPPLSVTHGLLSPSNGRLSNLQSPPLSPFSPLGQPRPINYAPFPGLYGNLV